jgi:arylformamidase
MKQTWDISPPVDAHSPVFSGDTVYAQRLHFGLGPNCPVNVHAITLSPHTGAHADAPLHYSAGAAPVGALGLEPYLGPCRVIHCLDAAPLVQVAHLAHALRPLAGRALPQRVLIRTAKVASQAWDAFTALDATTLDYLAAQQVLLVGIDTPSVDPPTSQTMAAHQALLRHDMRVLENLVLDDVDEGDYELIALPLKLSHSDASPVRAILREL